MKNFKNKDFKALLKKLSADPTLKAAIDQAKADVNGGNAYQATSILNFVSYFLKYTTGFVGKKKAQKLSEYFDYLVFIISVGVLLKKNVFDNPEVRAFFERNWIGSKKQFGIIYEACAKFFTETYESIKTKVQK